MKVIKSALCIGMVLVSTVAHSAQKQTSKEPTKLERFKAYASATHKKHFPKGVSQRIEDELRKRLGDKRYETLKDNAPGLVTGGLVLAGAIYDGMRWRSANSAAAAAQIASDNALVAHGTMISRTRTCDEMRWAYDRAEKASLAAAAALHTKQARVNLNLFYNSAIELAQNITRRHAAGTNVDLANAILATANGIPRK